MVETKGLMRIALFAALTAVGGLIKIPAYVPFTLQTLFAMLAGALLSRKEAVASQLIYLALGLIGVPVFASGGGLSYVLTPTFGYALFLPFLTLLIGFLLKIRLKPVLSFIISAILLLLFGSLYFFLISRFYLSAEIGFKAVFVSCFLVFVPVEVAKALVAALAYKRMKGRV